VTNITVGVADAFELCESITKTQARNFYYGIRLLRPDKRAALCVVYALARRIDDIGDGDLPRTDKFAALAQLRGALADLDRPGADPVLIALAEVTQRLPLPLGAVEELIDGVEMDVLGRHYADFDELVGYCRCVAGAVGRLCLAVFGSRRGDSRASEYADALGIALQQVNILRDIREDLGNGRVYVPQQDLDRFGVQLALDERGVLIDAQGRLTALIRYSAQRAHEWYAEQPSLVFDRRLSLSGWQKAEVAMRALVGTSASGSASGSAWGASA
jgi:15-cis-phytoene synthase